MSDDAKSFVTKFLNENGYPFEMKVAKEFKKQGFGIKQSVYFPDPNINLWREIDVVALWHGKFYGKIFHVFFVVECKYAKTPWIMFSSMTGSDAMCYSHNNSGKNWLEYLIKQPHFSNFFEIESNVGYGLTASSKENDPQKDNAYKAIQSVLSFLKSEIIKPKFSAEGFTFFVPIIAIRGKLFNADLDEKDEIICNEIKEGQVYYNESFGEFVPKIHIITEDILCDYITRLREDVQRLFLEPYMSVDITNPSLYHIS